MKRKTLLFMICCLAIGMLAACSSHKDSQAQEDIGADKALEIALKHAGVNEDDVVKQKVHLSKDDGIAEYEVEFYVGNEEYDYDIDAATGEIRSFDSDIDDDFFDTKDNSGVNQDLISEADAMALVLERVPGASEADIRIHLDRDDGRDVYEGELIYDKVEYEFEIDAASGEMIQWEEESHH
ncbi:MAG: PepSY domain-containing protein [Bacillota bacterium]|nr:PepSY domain-containing protein [Bacillota bacterium]